MTFLIDEGALRTGCSMLLSGKASQWLAHIRSNHTGTGGVGSPSFPLDRSRHDGHLLEDGSTTDAIIQVFLLISLSSPLTTPVGGLVAWDSLAHSPRFSSSLCGTDENGRLGRQIGSIQSPS